MAEQYSTVSIYHIFLTIHQLEDIWVVSTFWLLWIPVCVYVQVFMCMFIFSFPGYILGVKLLDVKITLRFNFLRISKLFSRLQSSLYRFVVSLLAALKSMSPFFICKKKEYTWGFAGGEVWARMEGDYYPKTCFSYLFLNITMQCFFPRNFRETNW